MKVLVDATMLDGAPCGAATRLAALGAALARRDGLELLHLVRPGLDPLPGLACRPFAGSASPLGRALAGPRLAALARRERAHLFAAGALPLPGRVGVPMVLTLHDLRFLLPGPDGPWLRRAWGRWRLPAQLRRPRAIVAVSRSTARALKDRGLGARGSVAVVPNAATPGLERKPDTQAMAVLRRRMNLSGRYVLALGPVERRRRWPLLLQALARVRADDRGRDLQLLLVGRAPRAGALALAERARELGLADALRVAGVLPDEELATALSGADALAVTCESEGFCIPVVDAQRLGVPVVAVKAGALPEVGGDAAWYAPPGDAPAFARALLAALEPDDDRRRRVEQGRRLAAAWSWDRSAELLQAVWEWVSHPPAVYRKR